MERPHPDITYPVETPPGQGEAVAIAARVLWFRLPLPMALDHVNVFAFDDGPQGWTVVDTGADNPGSREIWERLLAGPLGGRPVWRLIVTHFHPDHAGLAAFLMERGAELWCSRATYLMTRMLVLDRDDRHPPQTLRFWRDCGLDAETMAQRKQEPPFRMAAIVGLIPPRFRRIVEGDLLEMGGREWVVRLGEGHAPEQATLWDRAGEVVIGADQLLPRITPNLSVFPAEPMADPIGDWLESCSRLSGFATPQQLALPGHGLPFAGLPARLWQLADHHHDALDRLAAHLARPRVAVDCFAPLFRRRITPDVFGMALGETVAHLNRLLLTGRASRERRDDGAWLWVGR